MAGLAGAETLIAADARSQAARRIGSPAGSVAVSTVVDDGEAVETDGPGNVARLAYPYGIAAPWLCASLLFCP